MTIFAGHRGNIELKRINTSETLSLKIMASDITFDRKRFTLSSLDGADIPNGLITTGDRIKITTNDARGLPFRFYLDSGNTSYIDNPVDDLPLEFYANVDAMGAIRMYRSFGDAMANAGLRYLAVPLNVGGNANSWNVSVNILTGEYNALGDVSGFTLTTDRDSVDTTTLGNTFKNFTSSAISGGGTIDCLFAFKSLTNEELPIAIAQLIQKTEVGSNFFGRFYLLEPSTNPPPGYGASDGVFYELYGLFTKSAMTVRSDAIVECSFDFITTGEIVLRAGVQLSELTTENDVRIGKESTLEELGVLLEAD